MHDQTPISTLCYVGDACEELVDALCADASALGSRGIRALVFQEGDDAEAERAFREIARLTHGAYCRFSPGSARELGELLRAAAVYAAGGTKALSNLKAQGAIKLLTELK